MTATGVGIEGAVENKMAQSAAKEAKERRGSYGNIEEMLKRKRGDQGEGKEEEESFRSVKKTIGVLKDPVLGRLGGEGEMQEIIKSWRNEMEDLVREMRSMKGWKEEIRNMKEEVKEGIKEQGKMMREEVEELRREFGEREKRWLEEREELRWSIKMMERKIEKLEKRGIGEAEGSKALRREGDGEMGNKVKEIERRMERREREERKRNVLIKGVEVKEGRRRIAIEEVFASIGVKVEIEGVKRIGGVLEGGREMILVRLKDEEQKKEIWDKKKMLRGRKERIMEDWTWKERRMRWRLEEMAKEEEKKGRKVRISYGKIRIDEKWWRWDEEEEVLKDGNGNVKKEERLKDKEGEVVSEQGEM